MTVITIIISFTAVILFISLLNCSSNAGMALATFIIASSFLFIPHNILTLDLKVVVGNLPSFQQISLGIFLILVAATIFYLVFLKPHKAKSIHKL